MHILLGILLALHRLFKQQYDIKKWVFVENMVGIFCESSFKFTFYHSTISPAWLCSVYWLCFCSLTFHSTYVQFLLFFFYKNWLFLFFLLHKVQSIFRVVFSATGFGFVCCCFFYIWLSKLYKPDCTFVPCGGLTHVLAAQST